MLRPARPSIQCWQLRCQFFYSYRPGAWIFRLSQDRAGTWRCLTSSLTSSSVCWTYAYVMFPVLFPLVYAIPVCLIFPSFFSTKEIAASLIPDADTSETPGSSNPLPYVWAKKKRFSNSMQTKVIPRIPRTQVQEAWICKLSSEPWFRGGIECSTGG